MQFTLQERGLFQNAWDAMNEAAIKEFKVISSNEKSNSEGNEFNKYARKLIVAGDLHQAEGYYKRGLTSAEYNGYVFGKLLYNYAQMKILQRNHLVSLQLLDHCLKTTYGEENYIEVNTSRIKVCGLLGKKNEQHLIYKKLAETTRKNEISENELDEAKEYLSIKYDWNAMKEEELIAKTNYSLFEQAEIHKTKGYIAKKEIKKGEIILLECPEAIAGLDYCFNCHKRCFVMIPCVDCIQAVYCSEVCREEDQIHVIECGFYRSRVYCCNDANTILALRLFASNFGMNLEEGELVIYSLKPDSDQFLDISCINKKFYDSTLANNVTLIDAIYLTAYFITIRKDLAQYHQFIGLVLMKLLIAAQYRLLISAPSQYEINFMVYLHYPLFRHACNPNTIKYLSGSKIVLKAAEDIEKGKMIFINYGNVNYAMRRSRRQHLLKQYYCFECKCELCIDTSHGRFRNIIKCSKCIGYGSFKEDKLICEECGNSEPIVVDVFIYFKRIYELVMNYQKNPHISDLEKAINLGKKIMLNPNHFLISTAYFQLGKDELFKGQLKKCLDYIQDLKPNRYNYMHYVDIITVLEKQIQQLFRSEQSPYQITQLGKKDLNKYLTFLKEAKEIFQMYQHKKSLMDAIVNLEKFYTILKNIVEFENATKWRK